MTTTTIADVLATLAPFNQEQARLGIISGSASTRRTQTLNLISQLCNSFIIK